MQRDPRAYLFGIQSAAEAILAFVNGADFKAFTDNDMMRSAVERKFETIGEAMNRLSKAAPDLAAQISERARIIGFRNILIHGYDIVDPAVVWLAAIESLPGLRTEMSVLLQSTLEPPPSP